MANDIEMMRLALEEAELARMEGEVPVGAVIVWDGEVLARAHNRVVLLGDPSAHAEILAIRDAAKARGDWRLNGMTLYVTLEPCPMCAGAVIAARMDRIVFGAYDERYGCAGSVYRITEDPIFPHFTRADGGVLRAECEALLAKAFGDMRR